MTRRRRRDRGYVCEWSDGASFRDGRDYIAHVAAKHENGLQPLPQPDPDHITTHDARCGWDGRPDSCRLFPKGR